MSQKEKPLPFTLKIPDDYVRIDRDGVYQFDNKPELFFDYWKSLGEGFEEKPSEENPAGRKWVFRCYVYRRWPHCDYSKSLDVQEDDNFDKNIGVWTNWPFPDGLMEQHFLEMHGSGKYSFMLSDVVSNRTIAKLNEWTMSHLAQFPPKIRVDDVIMNDRYNNDFINWARQAGVLFPTDKGYEPGKYVHHCITGRKDDSPMQEKLMEKIFDKAFEEKTPSGPTMPMQSSVDELIASSAIQTYSNATGKLIESLIQRDNRSQPDNSALMLKVLDVAKEAYGNRPDVQVSPSQSWESFMAPMKSMMDEQREFSRMQIDFLKEEVKTLRQRNVDIPQPKTIIEQIREAKELLGEFGGHRSSPTVIQAAPEQSLVTTIIESLPEVLGSLAQAMNAYAQVQAQQMRMANGATPPAYQPAPFQQAQQQQPQPQQFQQAQQPANQPPANNQQPQQSVNSGGVAATDEVNYDVLNHGITEGDLKMIAQIYHPLLKQYAATILKYWLSVEDEESAVLNGVSLGSWFLDGEPKNEQIHNQLAMNATMTIGVIDSYKPLSDEFRKQPALAEIFIRSFLDRAKIDALATEVEVQEGESKN